MKLKAFSFLEVLVSIVIAGIVISTGYSVYVFAHQQFFTFTSVKSEIRDYYELSNVLNREFETAKQVIKTGVQEIQVQQVDKTVSYAFFNDHILRTTDHNTDTFFVGVTESEINLANEQKEEMIVNYLKLTFNDDNGDKVLSLHKHYGAVLMIE